MMNFPSHETVNRLKSQYPEGTRVKCLFMDDPFSPIEPGTLGTVRTVDDAGTVHVNWDNGSSLGLAYGEDKYVKLEV